MLRQISGLLVASLVLGLLIVAGCAQSASQEGSVITEDESREIAEQFLRSSPTFRFDGIEDSVKLVSTSLWEKPYCWEFNYEFQCRHAGYGDRSGKIVAQVITSHRAQIVVQEGEVTYAMLDDKWDMLNQSIVKGG